jgi:hypothetical protein
VTICIQDIVPVEDVGRGYKTAEQVFKSNLLAFGEISSRHLFCGELEEACGKACDRCTGVHSTMMTCQRGSNAGNRMQGTLIGDASDLPRLLRGFHITGRAVWMVKVHNLIGGLQI